MALNLGNLDLNSKTAVPIARFLGHGAEDRGELSTRLAGLTSTRFNQSSQQWKQVATVVLHTQTIVYV